MWHSYVTVTGRPYLGYATALQCTQCAMLYKQYQHICAASHECHMTWWSLGTRPHPHLSYVLYHHANLEVQLIILLLVIVEQ